MAITLVQGTLNPASTQKARDIRQALATSFAGISGWTLVDHDYVNGTAERSVITNTAGFAIMILNNTTLTNNEVWFAVGESYTLATHTLNKVAIHSTSTFVSTTLDANGYSTFNVNPTTPSAIQVYGNNSLTARIITGTTAQTNWTAHIDTDMVVFGVKTGTFAEAVYLGSMTSLVENPLVVDSVPVGIAMSNTTNNGLTGMLVNPTMKSINTTYANFSYTTFYTSGYGAPASTSYADKYSSQPTLSALSDIYLGRAGTVPDTNANLYGFLRGKLRSVKYSQTANANWGDNLTVATKTYMYLGFGWWVGIN